MKYMERTGYMKRSGADSHKTSLLLFYSKSVKDLLKVFTFFALIFSFSACSLDLEISTPSLKDAPIEDLPDEESPEEEIPDEEPPEEEPPDTTPPTAPKNLSIGDIPEYTNETPTLSWEASTDTGSGVASYQVRIFKAGDDSNVTDWTTHITGNKLTGLSLEYSTEYYFKVQAIDNAGNISEESASYSWTTISDACPVNYILVPKLAGYTTQDFCVAKYEMKKNGDVAESKAEGSPWVHIARGALATTNNSAWKACRDLGVRFDLISNSEWQTIARNIETVGSNWSSTTVGDGLLPMGWSASTTLGSAWANASPAPGADASCLFNVGVDTCGSSGDHIYRRTHSLSNGQVIWDFAGNVREWVKDNYADLGVSPAISGSMNESSALSENNRNLFASANSSYNSAQGIGRVSGGSAGAVVRGGSYFDGTNSGIFAALLGFGWAYTTHSVGFRCVFHP